MYILYDIVIGKFIQYKGIYFENNPLKEMVKHLSLLPSFKYHHPSIYLFIYLFTYSLINHNSYEKFINE